MKDLPKQYCKPLLWVILALILSSVTTQAKELHITPLITNFSRATFSGQSQIWDIDQSESGLIYAATYAGLYEFDGERWILHLGGVGTNLRSVFCDKGKIYTGGYGGYGYWEYNDSLQLVYYPLAAQELNQSSSTEEFWNITKSDDEILFQSKNQLQVYNRISNKITIIHAETGFDNLHSSSYSKVYLRDVGNGIFYYKDRALHLLPNTKAIASNTSAIFSFGEELYFAVSNSGIYHYKDGLPQITEWEINDKLSDEKVFCAQSHSSYGFLIGTVRSGLFLCDLDGNIIKNYDKKGGIKGNTILSIYIDNSNDIWLGADGGMSYIQEGAPIQKLMDEHGQIGSVYSSLQVNEDLLLATNQGLYKLSPRDKSYNSTIIAGSQGQTWSISLIDDVIFVGHHNGAFTLENGLLKQISNVTGAWSFIQPSKNVNVIIGGSYNGLSLYKKTNDIWKYEGIINGFNESARFLEFDRLGYLWVAHPVKGYYRISLDDTYQNCEDIKYYPMKSEQQIEPVYFTKIDGDLIFYNPTGFYEYNPIKEDFDPNNYMNNLIPGKHIISSVKQIGDYFWIVSDNDLKCVKRVEENISQHNQSLYLLDDQLLGDFTTFTPFYDDKVIIGMIDGTSIINTKKLEIEDSIPFLMLRQVKKIGIEGSESIVLNNNNTILLENKYGNIRFLFASPSNLKYTYDLQYKLSKYQEEWSDWHTDAHIDLIGLSSGKYELSVRARDKNKNLSSISHFKIKVELPNYLSSIMITLYSISLIGIVVLLIFFFRHRALMKERNIKEAKEIQLQLKLEKLETKALQIEKEKMLLEENQLKNELSRINNDLIAISMNNVKKNDILQDLRECVNNINSISQNPKVINYSGSITSKIDKVLNSQDDWITFELNFKNAHQGFFDRITLKHPELSPNDLKLCAYLRLNLSTKEIASLINISPRSVEVARYRLRQKLQLPTSDNLIKYILDT